MALDKAGLKSALESIFLDVAGKDGAEKAQEIADAVDEFVKTALLQVTIPAGTVVTVVTGGAGAPAVGVLNAAPISLSGDPNAGTGGAL